MIVIDLMQAMKPVPLTQKLQQQCVDWGAYWETSDAQGVRLTQYQAIELLRTALGVEVELKPAQPVQPAPEYQQVAYMWIGESFAGSPRVCYHEFSPGNIDNAEPLYRKLSIKEAK